MKEALYRAARTFIQAFAGFISANAVIYFSSDLDFDGIKTALCAIITSAVAAGLAAVMNIKKGAE